MKKNLFATLSLATLSAFAFNANSFAVEPCTFYMKLDGGLSMSPKAKIDRESTTTPTTCTSADASVCTAGAAAASVSDTYKFEKGSFGPQIGGEVGYYWNEALSTGFKVNYLSDRNKDKIKKDTDPYISQNKTPIYLKRTTYTVALTLNYDFNNSSDFVPFVGVEAGAAINRYKIVPIKDAITAAAFKTKAETANAKAGTQTQKDDLQRSIVFENTATTPQALNEVKSKTRITPHVLGKVGVGYNVSDNVRLTLEGKVSFNGKVKIVEPTTAGGTSTSFTHGFIKTDISKYDLITVTKFTKKPSVDFGVGLGVQFFM